jgi:hypothetical protein
LSFRKSCADCAVSFTPRQPKKGDALRENGRLRDLFGVAEEALSGRNYLKRRWASQHTFNLIFRFERVFQRSAIAYANAGTGNLDDVAPS